MYVCVWLLVYVHSLLVLGAADSVQLLQAQNV